MAVTQITNPSWDEEVVPALRKRLESESRTIAKRMSTVSINSIEEHIGKASDDNIYSSTPDAFSARTQNEPPYNGQSRRPVQQSRTSSDRSNSRTKSNGSNTEKNARARTYSQPYTPELANGSRNTKLNSGLRSESPRPGETKPTRIPVRSRAGSVTANNASSYPYNVPKTPTVEYVDGRSTPSGSRSTVAVISRQNSGLLNEPPPFHPGSSVGSIQSSPLHEEFDEPRPSQDSEERPYEHWYRGEVSRNGGVGELKVGKRQEMLDIANHGHRFEPAGSDRNAIRAAIEERRRGMRKRADSIGGIGVRERESFYMDEERAREIARVLDEVPLTDIETDPSEGEHFSDYHTNHYRESPPPLPTDYRSTTPTPSGIPRPSSRQQSGRPPNSRYGSEPPRSVTPTSMARGASEPPFSSVSSLSHGTPMSSQSRTKQGRSASSSTPSDGKRGQSPAPFSASKKARTDAAKATRERMAKAKLEADAAKDRRSVAYYPTPSEGMEDAVPTWTQPVPRTGNWDDVVLPVVARKKGLDDYYQQADGSPQPKAEPPAEPAPGTFGYDYSKYRPPRDDDPQYARTDEFGFPRQNGPSQKEEPDYSMPSKPPISTPYDETRVGPRPHGVYHPPPSPVPFSNYATMPSTQADQRPAKLEMEQQDDNAGCCKCVVM